jgi:ATP-dependent Lon protease
MELFHHFAFTLKHRNIALSQELELKHIPLIVYHETALVREKIMISLSRNHPFLKKMRKDPLVKQVVIAFLKKENEDESTFKLQGADDIDQLESLYPIALLANINKINSEYFNDHKLDIEITDRVKLSRIELEEVEKYHLKKLVYADATKLVSQPGDGHAYPMLKSMYYSIKKKIEEKGLLSKHAEFFQSEPKSYEEWADKFIVELKLIDEERFKWIQSEDVVEKFNQILEAYLSSAMVEWQIEEELNERMRVAFSVKKQRDKIMLRLRSLRRALNMLQKEQFELAKSQREAFSSNATASITPDAEEAIEGAEQAKEEEDETSIEARLNQLQMKPETRAELSKLIKQQQAGLMTGPEAHHLKNHLEWILSLPWERKAEYQPVKLKALKDKLDQEHAGLKEVKERMLEYMATRELSQRPQASILCLAGPPGVGKTTLARAIAESLNKPFVRIALGGMHDESDIRGHRRTYVAAIPGRVIYALKQAKVKDPVILLDEIDKMGADRRGSPEAALLEVLDPEQNHEFRDHYLELPVDLSEALFICTANQISNLSPPLRDRLEIVELSGYRLSEKLHIAKQYLLPKQLEKHGLQGDQIKITDDLLKLIVNRYTKEAGVRQLDRAMAKLCRKLAKATLEEKEAKDALKESVATEGIESTSNTLTTEAGVQIKAEAQIEVPPQEASQAIYWTLSQEQVYQLLGAPSYDQEERIQIDRCGISNGLAWTSVGGEVLNIECVAVKGKGALQLTGQMGSVMQESAKAALSALRADASKWCIDDLRFSEQDFHIHIPEGATPKDGPSAGVTIYTALASLLSQRKFKSNFAMSGECTISGRVLAVGGLKEKILAAKRYEIDHLVLPHSNRDYVLSQDQEILEGVTFYWVKDLYEAAHLALA